MGAVRVTIRLKSVDDYIRRKHGRPRAFVPNETRALAAWGDRMMQYIKDRWPVDTGTSRDRWEYYIDPTPGTMAIVIENPMYYADFVHYVGGNADNPLWSSLIPEAFNLIKSAMLTAAYNAVDATERAIERRRRAGMTGREATIEAARGREPPPISDLLADIFGV